MIKLLRGLGEMTAIFAVVVLAAASAATTEATSGAHFFKDTAASVNDNGSLSIHIDEAGVGQALVNYSITGTDSAAYACINGGSNHPKAANKATLSNAVAASVSESPINGRVEATISPVAGTPPGPGSFSCPSGQTLVLAAVSYSVTLDDTTNSASISFSTSRTFFTF